MFFNHLIGNEQAKQYLTRTVERGTVGNSLLFAGAEGVGKSLFAEAFAKMLLCQDDPSHAHRYKIEAGNHPDIRVYRPEGKIGMHSIASMRQFSNEVYFAPFEAKWKFFIIHEADRMLSYSANALLKTFEEPAKDAVIILLSSNPAALLPTVRSRCRTIHFHPLSPNEVAEFIAQKCNKPMSEAHDIAAKAQGSLGRALHLAKEGGNPLRALVLDLLSHGSVLDYKQLSASASAIAESIEEKAKEMESEVRTILLHGSGENLSAAQKQSIEKEVDGVLAMHLMQEAHALFEIILAWYRDMHLIRVNGDRAYLMHPDYADVCAQAFERGEMIALEKVQAAISDARLSLERSTSLHICFENLFLKLNLTRCASFLNGKPNM